ncbi:hypothetical protein ACTHT4_02395 [Neisseria sp. P0022.S007]|mgnify:CR=1 FL=1|uniref:hypothetical protein n=1 Tax=unclassified Neisseria TaxID=2623750 RepID=UPI003F7DAE7E
MSQDKLRQTIKRFMSTLTAVGVMATASNVYSQSVQTIDPELSIQKLANYPTNRETRRKLTLSKKNAFAELYRDLSTEFSRKFRRLPEAVQLFSSILVDIAANDELKGLIHANELTDIRDDIQKSMEQIIVLDKVLYTLEKLTGQQDTYQIHALFKKIIEVDKQALSCANQFYAAMYHYEMVKIAQTRSKAAFTFNETHSRDDIRRVLFGEA